MNSNRPSSQDPPKASGSSPYQQMSGFSYQQLLQTKTRIEDELFQTQRQVGHYLV